MAVNDTYHSFLMDYASGALDEAYALIIATHMALSPNARRIVREYESLGGGLLQECCKPVAMSNNALQAVLERLDCVAEECTEEEKKACCAEAEILPECLRKYVQADADHLPWHKTQAGLQSISVKTSCQHSAAELMRIKAGTTVPHHVQQTFKITLVLDGALKDGGQIYSRGDIIIMDEQQPRKTYADKKEGCVALIVTSGAVPHSPNVVGKLFQIFSR